MTVNEMIKSLQKLKRQNKECGEWELAIRVDEYREPKEITGVTVSDYDDCIEIIGDE